MYKMSVPIIQGGMGVGISMGSLAGAVAAEGGMGVISTANIGFREKDFWSNPQEANCRALEKEIRRAREISDGKGLIAVNAMVATKNFAEMVKVAVKSGIDAVISGAGLPLNLPDLVDDKTLIAPIVSVTSPLPATLQTSTSSPNTPRPHGQSKATNDTPGKIL